MVVISRDFRNVVNRIFFNGIAYNGSFSLLYSAIIKAFDNLDKSISNIYVKSVNNALYVWKQGNMLVLRIGNLMFSYLKVQGLQGETVVAVHEVFENNQIVTELRKR